jgi:DNA-binding NarL/FixJ family response regulator
MARVALIDDDPEFLSLTERALADMGVTVVATAQTAQAALGAVEASRPDAVLVDIGLPDRDGIDLALTLAALPWRPRVVLTSSDGDALGPDRCEGARGLPFIPKDELESDAVRRLLMGN